MSLLRTTTLVLAFIGMLGSAAAQTTSPKTGAGPEGALPGPNATTPAADQHSPQADQSAQPVPGAWPGSDTVPSTISEQHAADDKLITAAHTFKNLKADERATIFNGLKDSSSPHQLAAEVGAAEIGIELPYSIELRPLPDAVVSKVPQTKGYSYVAAGNKVLLVRAATRFVVAVIDDPAAAATTGAGSGSLSSPSR